MPRWAHAATAAVPDIHAPLTGPQARRRLALQTSLEACTLEDISLRVSPPLASPLLLALALLATGPARAQVFEVLAPSAGFEPSFLANIPGGGIAVADFDGDGLPDIFVTGYFLANRLFYNQGDGSFLENPAINAQVAGQQCNVVAAADFDNDGWVDVYVACRDRSNLLLRNLAGQGFENVIQPAIDHAAVGSNSPRVEAIAWGDLTGNGHLDLFLGVYPAMADPDLANPDNLDRILLNHGDGSWTEVAGSFVGADRAKLGRAVLAAIIADLDDDGRPDIYVVNDKLHGNTLWRNLGPGCGSWCFGDVSAAVGALRPAFGMGVAVADLDRSGRWDLYYSSIDEQVLLRGTGNPGAMQFVEDSESVLNHRGVGWSTILSDFDNDGWDDAYLAVNSGNFSTTSSVDQLFRNRGDGEFDRVTMGSGLDQARPTEAAARIDFDRDGRLDLVLGHWNQGYRLYRNISPQAGNWLGLSLRGGGPVNRGAVGAVVEVHTGAGNPQRRMLSAGESRGSSHEPVLHFGLGAASEAQVRIHWPDGLVEDIGVLAAGQYHHRLHPAADPIFASGFSSD